MPRRFDQELKILKEKLLRMASLAEEAISLAVGSLKNRQQQLAEKVFDKEEEINLLDIELDEICLRLLALRQPMAIDLRFITSALKITSDLERIGDQAINIAERSLELIKLPLLKPLIDLPRMADLAQGMVKDAIDAFIKGDDQLAKNVCERDDEV
ncbi:MAG: phosphate signaling complex protein PhoU, partial [Candidatus Aminicenantales bacterium]